MTAPTCATCRWWHRAEQRVDGRIDPTPRARCLWPAPPWVAGDTMRYATDTDCRAHEPEAMPHG